MCERERESVSNGLFGFVIEMVVVLFRIILVNVEFVRGIKLSSFYVCFWLVLWIWLK